MAANSSGGDLESLLCAAVSGKTLRFSSITRSKQQLNILYLRFIGRIRLIFREVLRRLRFGVM
jgi:hypothetical protein